MTAPGWPRSLLWRFVLLSGLWIALALGGGWIVIGGVLDRFVVARFEAGLDATAEGLISRLTPAEGELVLDAPLADPRFARPLSGWFWQVETGGGVSLVSESLFLETLLPPYDVGPDGQGLLAQLRTVTVPGVEGSVGIVVTAPRKEVMAALGQVRQPLFWSLAALGAGLVLLAMVQGRMALSGYRHIGAGIAAIRAGTAERLPRRGLAEVDAPVDEVNTLLDRNRAVIARSREHVGNLAHALKTPLAALMNDARPGSDGAVAADRMDRLIRYHLRRARTAGAARLLGARTPVLDVVEDIALVLRGQAAERAIAIGVDVPEGLVFAGEREDLEDITGNLMENAVQWANSRVEVYAEGSGDSVHLTIKDDGPGIGAEHLEKVLRRGGRLDESVSGSGLGLGIVSDLVALNDGDLTFGAAPDSGLCVEVRLPRAQ